MHSFNSHDDMNLGFIVKEKDEMSFYKRYYNLYMTMSFPDTMNLFPYPPIHHHRPIS